MKIVRTTDDGGCFPPDLNEKLDWFFENFDLKRAAKGEFEPAPGMSEDYDNACETIENIKRELEEVKHEMCKYLGKCALSSWKYINTKEDAKEKYLIELPSSVPVPNEFEVKGKRGKGQNQVNKYRSPVVERLVEELERAIDIKNEGKAMGMKLVFAKFDSQRDVWMAANHATAMLGKNYLLLLSVYVQKPTTPFQFHPQTHLDLLLSSPHIPGIVDPVLLNVQVTVRLESRSSREDILVSMSHIVVGHLFPMT